MADPFPEYVRTPSGLILPEYAAERRYAPRQPIAVDFFSGCGGFSLGLIQAGFHVVAAVENDPIAVITYMSNLARYDECKMVFIEDSDRERMERQLRAEMKRSSKGKTLERMPTAGCGWISQHPRSTPGVNFVFVGDVRKLTGDAILRVLGLQRGEIDLVCGGPPCQGFSVSGKRDVADPRNNLVFEYARMIVELKPKTMVMENVPGIVTMVTPDGLSVVDTFCRILEDGDFATIEAVKRSLASQLGAAAVLRTKPGAENAAQRRRSEQRAQALDPVDNGQLGLFDG